MYNAKIAFYKYAIYIYIAKIHIYIYIPMYVIVTNFLRSLYKLYLGIVVGVCYLFILFFRFFFICHSFLYLLGTLSVSKYFLA